MKKLYAEISKMEPQDDGTLKVWGYASTEAVDSDGETVTADAMKAALPDYMKFGAVREMHQPSAAGTAIEAKVEDDGKTFFGAHVVDPVAVKKVEAGVYKGFSIGGKVTERDELNKSVIKAIKLVEVSLVDRPANPEAVFTMYKADDLDKQTGEGAAPQPEPEGQSDEPMVKVLVVGENSLSKAQVVEALSKWEGQEIMDASVGMDVMRQIVWLLDSEIWQAQQGEDESGQLAALRAAISSLKEFVISELQEDNRDPLAMSDATGDLAKAGAKFSKATKDALSAVHKAVNECSEHLDKLGYMGDDDDSGADDDDSTGKAAADQGMAKLAGDIELVKADLAKVEAERDELKKRVEELEQQPATPKGAVKVVLSKSEDTGGEPVVKMDPIVDAKGEVNEVASLIKMIHTGAAAQQ